MRARAPRFRPPPLPRRNVPQHQSAALSTARRQAAPLTPTRPSSAPLRHTPSTSAPLNPILSRTSAISLTQPVYFQFNFSQHHSAPLRPLQNRSSLLSLTAPHSRTAPYKAPPRLSNCHTPPHTAPPTPLTVIANGKKKRSQRHCLWTNGLDAGA